MVCKWCGSVVGGVGVVAVVGAGVAGMKPWWCSRPSV